MTRLVRAGTGPVGCAAVHPSGNETTERRVGGRHAAARPVFVDASGRRQRRVRRIGRLLAVPAAGYVALLLVSALGGPGVSSPYLPLPDAGDHHRSPGPDTPGGGMHRTPAAGPGHPAGTGSPGGAAAPRVTAGPTAPAHSPIAHQPAGTATSPAPAATVTHGSSRATTHPVPSHTNHGHG
jgi:hypothetical protein